MGWLDSFKKPQAGPIEDFSGSIFKQAAEGVDAIRKLAEDKSVEQDKYGLGSLEWMKVFFEFQNFYLHLTDRFAFGRLDEQKRGKVMTELERVSIDTSVETICKDWPRDKIANIKKECMDNFLVSMQDYAQYKKLFPDEGQGPKDTLLWEFGKQIASLSGRPFDMAFIIAGVELASKALTELDINSFIAKVR